MLHKAAPLRTQRLRPPSESQGAARQLRVAFGAWSHDSTMSGAAFSRLCKRAGLCSRGFVLTDIDATFAAAAGYARKLTLAGFERAVTAIAVKREQSIDAIAEIIYAAGAPSKATAVAPVVDRPTSMRPPKASLPLKGELSMIHQPPAGTGSHLSDAAVQPTI